MAKKKFYITTSIAYTNDKPHIGFALELIQADVIARYNRIKGKDVWFLTGTDEHGAKVAKKAMQKNKSPQVFCDEVSKKFKELTKVLHISNNDFIRTTDKKRHLPAVHKLWKKLELKGDIYQKEYSGLYCLDCEAFMKKSDLIDNKCPYHKKKPEIVKEKNYFFRLSKYLKKIEKYIKTDKIKIIPLSKKNQTLAFIKKGIDDVSFSRKKDKVKWGIEVPQNKEQLVYVWGDALTNYLSAVHYTDDKSKFRQYWPADIHFIGKDILKFHALIWPAMLLSANLPLFKKIFVHGFITVEGQKMSKSLGNIIDPFVLVKKYGNDSLRYFLLREIPAAEDGDFSYQKFEERYNADLAKGLGNLTARIITLADKVKGQKTKGKNVIQDLKVKKEIDKTLKNYQQALDQFKFNQALTAIWKLIGFCDKYIEEKKPWQKSDQQKTIINDLLLTLKKIADLLGPFLPQTSENILKQITSLKSQSLFPRIES